MTNTYRAVEIRGPGKARLVTRPVPRPRAGEVLIRTAWQGVCATDLEILEGRLGYYASGFAEYPIVPGHELSGRVAAAGAGVRLPAGAPVVVECIQGCGSCPACRAGDAIGCRERRELGVVRLDGGYGEYVLVRARFVHRVPAGLTLRAASLVEPLAVVCKGLRRLRAAWGPGPRRRRVAVLGAGAIGTLAGLALAERGHRPVLFDRAAARRAGAARAGLEARGRLEGLSEFDAFIEATGSGDVLRAAVDGARSGSTLLLLGLPYDARPFSFEKLVVSDKALVGSVGSGARDFGEGLRLLRRLPASTLDVREFALGDYEKAWAAARAQRCLKAVLRLVPHSPSEEPGSGIAGAAVKPPRLLSPFHPSASRAGR